MLLLLPSEWFALITMLLLCGHIATGLCICTDIRPVCPSGLHVEGVLVICSRGTRVLVSIGKGDTLTYPLGRVPTSDALLPSFLHSYINLAWSSVTTFTNMELDIKVIGLPERQR
jgi:hypothetical protein